MKRKLETKNIAVKFAVKDKLDELKLAPGESYSSVVERLATFYEENHGR